MSIHIMNRVWRTSPLEGSALLVELALADHANAEGLCWPAIKTVAEQARCSESWVQKVVKQLRAMGRIDVINGGGRNKTNSFQFNLDVLFSEKGRLSPPFSAERVDSSPGNGGLQSSERVDCSPERVDCSPPDPSSDPSSDPSLIRQQVVRETKTGESLLEREAARRRNGGRLRRR